MAPLWSSIKCSAALCTPWDTCKWGLMGIAPLSACLLSSFYTQRPSGTEDMFLGTGTGQTPSSRAVDQLHQAPGSTTEAQRRAQDGQWESERGHAFAEGR